MCTAPKAGTIVKSKSEPMRIPWTVGVLMVSMYTLMASNATKQTTEVALASPMYANAITEVQIQERLASIDLPIESHQSAEIVRRVRQYINGGRHETETILGRTITYFPVFEHYLSLHGLPEDLKYLPMIESGLRPTVKSHVGAAGMWQLMGITARHHGLQVNGQIDERFDPYKSTEAAVRMLKYLHGQFDDWSLVLAAYNAGPGRIKSAVRYAGSTDYAAVAPHLPRETQRYVPAFVAAAYIANFYHLHELQPKVPAGFSEELRVITLQEPVSFRQIAEVTGLNYSEVRLFNPAYLQGYIPANRKGNFLALPASVMPKMRAFLLEKRQTEVAGGLVATRYIVAPGDNLDTIARMFNTSVEDIIKWNALGTQPVALNQELTLYLSRAYLINRA